jgi:hypothetical protein
VHGVLFALNTACAVVFFFFTNFPEASTPFGHLEVRINHLLRIRQTDFIRGHFQFWVPALALALCSWIAMRVSSWARPANSILRSFAGATAFFLLPTVWICADPHRRWLFVWPYEVSIELVAMIFAFFLFLCRSRSISIWLGFAVAATHYVFWYWLYGGLHVPNWSVPGYFGPAGLILALCTSLAWVGYVRTD